MSTYKFKPSERYAVYTTHGDVCYLCRKPIDMVTFQVDHIIPEHLKNDFDELKLIFESYGLPENFDLNSFENWLPACQQCNNSKSGRQFIAIPIIAVQLQQASEKANKARELNDETKSTQKVARAITILETAHQQGTLGEIEISHLRPLLEFHQEHRDHERTSMPINLTPLLEVLNQDGYFVTVKGPYGIGIGHVNPLVKSNFNCPTCGLSVWNGARCVACGTLDDD